MEKVNYTREGFHTVNPMLAVKDAPAAIEWYKKVFQATEEMRLAEPDGTIAHAEIKIGDTIIMLAEERPNFNHSPNTLNGTSVILNLYVSDVDTVVQRAVEENATLIFPVNDQFYGDRSGRIEDPYGHMWIVSTRIKTVSVEEMQQQYDEILKADK